MDMVVFGDAGWQQGVRHLFPPYLHFSFGMLLFPFHALACCLSPFPLCILPVSIRVHPYMHF